MYTDHFYPPDVSAMQTNATLAVQNNKVYYIGEFDWTDQSHTAALGTISQDNTTSAAGTYSANIHITKNTSNPLNYWYVQLLSNNFTLQANTTYTVTFSAKASNNNYIETNLQQNANPYTIYKHQTYNLTSSWAPYTFTYTTSTAALTPVFLSMNLAKDTGHIWIDNISVSNGSGNLITNSSFESTVNWLSPWTLKIQSALGDAFTSFIPAVETTSGVSGDLYWSLKQHGCYYGFDNADAYSLHYPGDNPDYRNRIDTLKKHAFKIKGVAPADSTPVAPLLTWINDKIAWRGEAFSDKYTVERSFNSSGPWTVTCNACADDNQSPWTDPTRPPGQTVWYRIKAINVSGNAGAYSSPAISLGNNATLVDNLKDWSKSYSHTSSLYFETTVNQYNSDSSRAARSASNAEEIVWQLNGMTTFQAITSFWPGEAVSHYSFFTSPDASVWTGITPAVTMGGLGDWVKYAYTLSNLTGVNFVKIRWNNLSSVNNWTPQLCKVMIDKSVATGEKKLDNNESLLIYPNPGNDVLTIEENSRIKEINLFNSQGKMVYSEKNIMQTTFQLNISYLPSGLYFCRVVNETGMTTRKITISR